MKRELTSHRVNGLNDGLLILVEDAPGVGGGHHRYGMIWDQTEKDSCIVNAIQSIEIKFQDGPIAEVGINGVSNEALLAIVEDRLKCFQAGPYSCRENALALTHLQEAMHWLQHRTRERMQRGVEGTTAK